MATRPKTTRIADDTTQDVPQTTDPGDAPADTYDPKERASSAAADKAAAVAAGHQTVNAIMPVDSIPEPEAPSGGGRTETVTVYDNDGKPVEVTYNYDTGETTPTEPAG